LAGVGAATVAASAHGIGAPVAHVDALHVSNVPWIY
jgi:hypothetical protein